MSNKDHNSLEAKSSKGAFFPHPRSSKGKPANAGLIAGMIILGLIVGGGIAAGTIHAIQPLDGSTTIEKSSLSSNALYKTTGTGDNVQVVDVSKQYITKPAGHTFSTNGLYKTTGTDEDTTLGNDISNQYIAKPSGFTFSTDGLYKTTGTADATVLGPDVSTNYVTKPTGYTFSTDGLYKTTGTADDTVLSADVSRNYVTKPTGHIFSPTGLYRTTGTDTASVLGPDISNQFIAKPTAGLYNADANGVLTAALNYKNLGPLNTDDLYKKNTAGTDLTVVTDSYISRPADLADGRLYKYTETTTGGKTTGTLGTDVSGDYLKEPTDLADGKLYKYTETTTGGVTTGTLGTDVSGDYLDKPSDLADGKLYKYTETTTGGVTTGTLGADVSNDYVKKPTDSDKSYTFQFNTTNQFTLPTNTRRATIDSISSGNTSLSDDPAVAKQLSEITIKVGETVTLYLTSNKIVIPGTGPTSGTRNFFFGAKFNLTLNDAQGDYTLTTPAVTSPAINSNLFYRTGAGYSLDWNSRPGAQTNQFATGFQFPLSSLITGSSLAPIDIAGVKYFEEETVNRDTLNNIYDITQESSTADGELFKVGSRTNFIIKKNFKIYDTPEQSGTSLKLTRMSPGETKKFYIVAPRVNSATATLASGAGKVALFVVNVTKATDGTLTAEIEEEVKQRDVTDVTNYGDFSANSAGWTVVDRNDASQDLIFTGTQRTLPKAIIDYLFVPNSI